jgi:hypothetical protein
MKNFQSWVLVTLMLFTVGVCLEVQANPISGPTLKYENGGTLLAYHSDGQEIVAQAQSKLRNFIWSRWVKHKRARIAIEGSTVEGLPWRQNFVIEPNESGAWTIVVTFKGKELGPEEGKIYDRSIEYKAYAVKRIRTSGSPTPLGNGYRLILKDKGGAVRAEL